MKISQIVSRLEDLKKSFKNGKSLKLYCEEKNLSYTNTSRLLRNDKYNYYLVTACKLLGLSPEHNIPNSVLYTELSNLIELEKYFEKQFEKENQKNKKE